MRVKRIHLGVIGIFAFVCVGAQEHQVKEDLTAEGQTQLVQQNEQQSGDKEYIEKRYTIFFPTGRADVVEDYKGNGKTIQTMVDDLNTTLEAEGVIPDSLTIFASTSPEGPAALNERLAIQRANNAKEAIVKLFPQFKKENIKITSRANDWSGMILTLRRDTTFVHAKEILNVLTDPTITNKDAAIRGRLPKEYAALRDKMFDNMRTASVTISVIKTADNVDEFVVEPELFMSVNAPQDFPKEGGEGQVAFQKTVSDNVVPIVATEADWIEDITATPTGLTYNVKPNLMAEPRTAVMTVDCYGKSQEIVVNQAPADPVMTITSASPMAFPAEGGDGTITYERNSNDTTPPAVTSNTRWIDVTSTESGESVITVAENKAEKERSGSVTVDCYGQSHEVLVNQAAAVHEPKPFYMAVKTNMLYDLGLVPNVGVEFYLGKNFSVAGNWMYSWWKSDKKAWYWRTYGGDLAFRYWFGKAAKEKPLTGHHVGLYGQIVTYDFEAGGRGYLGDRWSYGAGLEYGYSLPIAKRLNIDFDLGVGYLGGEFKEYLPIDGHYVWQATKRRHWFGPTKLEVSLTWLLGRGNINKGKGGKR